MKRTAMVGLLLGMHGLGWPAAQAGVTFTEVSHQAGIDFQHVIGASGEKYYVETMGSGACWFDFDDDGDIDLYVVNSAELPGYKSDDKPINHLYRNEGKGRFTDVTAEAGVGDRRYGMGCTAGDIDNDGDLDLYVTNFGDNVMFRNEGNGRFTDITTESGTQDPRWSASAAFADIDNDGDLDLYVTNYLTFTVDNNKYCGHRKPGFRAYCHPDEYNGVSDSLFRNKGNGQFENVSVSAGISNPIGKGLGVVFSDFNDDGWQDIYVANDKTINFLYLNKKDGTFEDLSMMAGTGFSESGMPQAGMGTDSADVNGDGRLDLVVMNLDFETTELYINNGDMTFTDSTFQAGLGEPNFLHVSFGTVLFDFDNDTDMDLMVANGHIIDNIELYKDQVTYAQSKSLLANDGSGKFVEVSKEVGEDFSKPEVGRGLAVGDYDDDGDLDVFVVNSNRRAELLRNDLIPGAEKTARWIMLKLKGVKSNRNGVGARVRLMSRAPDGSERWQVDELRTGTSYCSQNDMRLHFGLGAATKAEIIEVRWPSGRKQRLENVESGQILVIEEPAGD